MPRRLALLVLGCVSAACSQSTTPSAPPAPAPPPLVSGLDTATFDTSVRPQDDLFRFVNGGWLTSTEIPPDKAAYGGFFEAFDRSQEQLKVLVETAAAGGHAPGSDSQKIGDFYTAFMDEARAEQLGLSPLAPELKTIQALSTKADLAKYLARQAKLSIGGAPLGAGVDGDAKDPTRNTLYIGQGGIGLPDRDYYLKDDAKLKEYRAKYVTYITTVLTAAQVPDPAKAAADILAFETRLARAHWTNVESRDAVKTYNKVAVADLPKEFPGLDWSAWTGEMAIAAAPAVVIAQPSFVKALATIVAATPVERWKPYLTFHAVDRFAPYLHSALVNARFDFRNRTLQGVAELQPRWKRALNNLDATVGELLGKTYVEKHFTPAAKARMDTLIENLRAAYREGIDGLEWMGPETKKEAHAKLAAFRPKIGYPSKWRDYSKVEIKRDDLVGNMMRALEADSAFDLGKRRQADRSRGMGR